MKPPVIVVVEGSYPEFFSSAPQAAAAMDLNDVYNDNYEAYDAEGLALDIRTEIAFETDPPWLGGGTRQVAHIFVEEPEEREYHTAELETLVREYFRFLSDKEPRKFPSRASESMALPELARLAEEYGLVDDI